MPQIKVNDIHPFLRQTYRQQFTYYSQATKNYTRLFSGYWGSHLKNAAAGKDIGMAQYNGHC